MDPETKKLDTSIDVVFDEISSYHSAQKTSNQEIILDGDPQNFEQLPESNLQEPNNEGSSNLDDVERQTERRSIREKRQPSYFKDYKVQLNCCSNTSCFFTGVLDEPVSYEEAKGHPEWNAAMQEDLDALNKNQTWELVSKPENCELITCKWVYCLKKNSDGVVDKYKARLVARGFPQSYGLDYEEPFSPVAKMVTVRTIFSLTTSMNWKLWQLDVKNAFLYGELDREVFMEQPKGYISLQYPQHVCQLKKALYALK